jgi:hypothetical protein
MPEPPFERSYEHTRPLARRGYLEWLAHRHGHVLATLLGLFVLAAWHAARGGVYRGLASFVAGGLATYFALLVRPAGGRAEDPADEAPLPVRVRLDVAGVHISSRLGESTTPWTAIRGVYATWSFVALMRRSSAQPLMVPTRALGDAACAFLRDQVKAAARAPGDAR